MTQPTALVPSSGAPVALTQGGNGAFPTPDEWRMMEQMANVLVKSGMMPAHIVQAGVPAALTVMLRGRGLGLDPLQAIEGISVIKGKATLSAELMLALIYRDHGSDAVEILETTDKRCVLSYRRRGVKDRRDFTFTWEEAQKAGLPSGNPTWGKYPAQMIRARAISGMARAAFPDCIKGMRTPEEVESFTDEGDSATPPTPPVVVTEGAPERSLDDVKAAMIALCQQLGEPVPVKLADVKALSSKYGVAYEGISNVEWYPALEAALKRAATTTGDPLPEDDDEALPIVPWEAPGSVALVDAQEGGLDTTAAHEEALGGDAMLARAHGQLAGWLAENADLTGGVATLGQMTMLGKLAVKRGVQPDALPGLLGILWPGRPALSRAEAAATITWFDSADAALVLDDLLALVPQPAGA